MAGILHSLVAIARSMHCSCELSIGMFYMAVYCYGCGYYMAEFNRSTAIHIMIQLVYRRYRKHEAQHIQL